MKNPQLQNIFLLTYHKGLLFAVLFSLCTLPIVNIIKTHDRDYNVYADDTQSYLNLDLWGISN